MGPSASLEVDLNLDEVPRQPIWIAYPPNTKARRLRVKGRNTEIGSPMAKPLHARRRAIRSTQWLSIKRLAWPSRNRH